MSQLFDKDKVYQLIKKYNLVKSNYFSNETDCYVFEEDNIDKVQARIIGINLPLHNEVLFAKKLYIDNSQLFIGDKIDFPKNLIMSDNWIYIKPSGYERKIKSLLKQYNELKLQLKKISIQDKLNELNGDF